MSGKRQLFLHRKYADPLPLLCFNLWLARQDEGCFREIHLASERLHLLVGQTARVRENRERIAGERCLRKNIELNEFVSAGHLVLFISLNSQQPSSKLETRSLPTLPRCFPLQLYLRCRSSHSLHSVLRPPGLVTGHSSRVTFSFDLHDFRGSSIFKRNPVTHVRGEERFADRRNPTDGVRFEIEFVNSDDGIGFGPAFFIFYRHRCAECHAVRRPVRSINNLDRRQNLFQFGDVLAVRVCCAKFLQFVAQMLRATRGDVISRAWWQSRRRSLPSAALRKIDIFFDKRPAHSKEYRTTVSFSVSDFAQPMSN